MVGCICRAANLNDALISYTNGVISHASFGDNGSCVLDDGKKLAKLFNDFVELLVMVTVGGGFLQGLMWVDTFMRLEATAMRTPEEMGSLLELVIADHQQRCCHGTRSEGDDHRDFVDMLLDLKEAEYKKGDGPL